MRRQGRHCPTLAGMARVETPVFFAHLKGFLPISPPFLPLCHRILHIVSPVFEIFKTPGMAIAIPAILVSPPLSRRNYHIKGPTRPSLKIMVSASQFHVSSIVSY